MHHHVLRLLPGQERRPARQGGEDLPAGELLLVLLHGTNPPQLREEVERQDASVGGPGLIPVLATLVKEGDMGGALHRVRAVRGE